MDLRKYAEFAKGSVCFVCDEDDSWRLCKITEVDEKAGKKVMNVRSCTEEGEFEEGLTLEGVDESIVATLEEGALEPVKDLLEMNYLHDSILLHQIRRRYWDDVIYTNIGAIVLALNPYNFNLPLYVDSNMPKYIEEKRTALHGGSRLPTHTWSVAHDAFWSMRSYDQPQSVLVSGESGAGKTEAAKIVTKYLARASTYFANDDEQAAAKQITDRIIQASPILEAFGNAKTLRNDNSSRFGKFMKLQFDPKGYLCGCYTINYLLEKSRVIGAAKGERVYHTFYQLIIGASDEQREFLRLGDGSKFAHLYESLPQEEQPVAQDTEDWNDVQQAFKLLDFTEKEVDGIYRIIAGILHLLNIHFKGTKDKSAIAEESVETVGWVAETVWQVDKEVMLKEFTSTTTKLRGETITKPLSIEQAGEVRDALCKTLYETTFQWIIDKLNVKLDKTGQFPETQWIGLLDIFGFENFAKNSFEQLCINFANEQLQNHYNTCVFARDIAEYEQEKINTTSINPPNNQPTLDLIGGRMGILSLLNDQARSGTDAKFLDAANEKHHRHKSYVKPKINNGTFGVNHYAAPVSYTAKGMREKNNDTMKDSLRLLMRSSEHTLIAVLLDPPDDSGGSKLQNTVSRFFQNSLQELIQLIDETNPHWIRCVKPHSAKKPRRFCGSEVMNQLRCAGVLETVKIRQTGYSMRIPHTDFWLRFRMLLADQGSTERLPDIPSLNDLKIVLQKAELNDEEAQIGSTKVFIKDAPYKQLEKKRNAKLDHLAIAIQRFVYLKTATNRKYALWLVANAKKIQQFTRWKSSSFVHVETERRWYDKRYNMAVMMQKFIYTIRSGRTMYKKRVHHHITLPQRHMRVILSQRIYRDKELAKFNRTCETVLLLQSLLRCKASEAIYVTRAEDKIDMLEAELDVKREMEEEKKQRDADRKKKLRDKIRAQKGLPPAGAHDDEEEESTAVEVAPKQPVAPAQPIAPSQGTVPVSTTTPPTHPQHAFPPGSQTPPQSYLDSPAMYPSPEPSPRGDGMFVSQQKMQSMMEKEAEMKRTQRQVQKLTNQLDQQKQLLKLKEKDMMNLKKKLNEEQRARKKLESDLHDEKLIRMQYHQQLIDKEREEDKREIQQQRLVEESENDPMLMQQLAESIRATVQETYEKLEKQEMEVLRLKTTAILRFPFGSDLNDAVKKNVQEICEFEGKIGDVPENDLFRPTDITSAMQTTMRGVVAHNDIYNALKGFCTHLMNLEKSISNTNCLPRDRLTDALKKPLDMLSEMSRLSAMRHTEEREPISLSGLEPTSAGMFSLGSQLERIKRTHEGLLKRLHEREEQVTSKLDKIGLVREEVGLLAAQLPMLHQTMEKLNDCRKWFDDQKAASAKENTTLKENLATWLTKQTDPMNSVETKRRTKEEELQQLREDLKEKRAKAQEDFFQLLQTEEMVAYTLRDYAYMTQLQQKVSQQVAKQQDVALHREEGMGAGAVILEKETDLVETIKIFLEKNLHNLKRQAGHSLGSVHELNYELILRHFKELQAFYDDTMQLLQTQRQELFTQEAKLYQKGKGNTGGGGLGGLFSSKEKQMEKQRQTVQKAKEQLRLTHDALMSIRDKFKNLFKYSYRCKCAEFLAKHNKEKYGELLSTNTIPDASETFTWPDMEEILERPAELEHLVNLEGDQSAV